MLQVSVYYLAGFHTQNIAIFELAEKYKKEGMTAILKYKNKNLLERKMVTRGETSERSRNLL